MKYLHVALLILAAALTSCDKPQPQEPCGFVLNPSGERLSWGGAVPVELGLDASIPVAWEPSINRAAATWNASVGHEVIRVTRTPARNTIRLVAIADPQRQGETHISWAGNRVFEADVDLSTRYDLVTENPTRWEVDLESLMVHELGHVLGLAHSEEPGSVMAPTLGNGQVRRKLSALDRENVRCGY